MLSAHASPRNVMRRLVQLIMVLGIALQSATALADPQEEAREHFERGVAAVDAGKLETAVTEFEQAYEAMPHFQVLYNLGQTHAALDRPLEAIEAYTGFLSDGGDDIDPAQRAEVRGKIAELEKRVARLGIEVEPAGALVTVDGKSLGAAPVDQHLHLMPGEHEVVVTHSGYVAQSRRVDIGAGDEAQITIVLAHEPAAEPLVVSRAPEADVEPSAAHIDEPPHRKLGARQMTGIATAATGLVLGVVGLKVWSDQGRRYQEWEEEDEALDVAFRSPESSDLDDLVERQDANNELIDSIHRRDNVALGLGIAGGVLVAAGTVMYFVEPSPRERAKRTRVNLGFDAHSGSIQFSTAF